MAQVGQICALVTTRGDHRLAAVDVREGAVDGRAIGLVIGAVGGTAFVVFNAPRVAAPFGVAAAVLAVAAFVGLIILLVRQHRDSAEAGADEALARTGGGAAPVPPAGQGMYGRGYRLVVAAEVLAFVVGGIVLGRLGLGLAVLPWVAFVVGVHFVALGRLWRLASLAWVGLAVAVCGAVGFALALGGAPDPAIAAAGGIAPGAALLAGSWWAATHGESVGIH